MSEYYNPRKRENDREYTSKKEQIRINLAIVFLATYLTLIFGLINNIKISPTINTIYFLVHNIFVTWGILISSTFFLYLVFTALEINFSNTKEVILDQEVSLEKLNKIRKFLFNGGVRLIFISFTIPIYYLFNILNKHLSITTSFILFSFFLILFLIILHLIFKDKNSTKASDA